MQEPANIGSTHAAFAQRRARIQERIIGQPLLVDRLLIALLADGHLLVEVTACKQAFTTNILVFV